MSTSFLSSNRKSFYHRITIPKNLRGYFRGRVEVWRSLKTKNKAEACYRAQQLESQAQRVFWTLKRSGNLMDQETIDRIVAQWLEVRLEAAEDFRAELRPISDDQRSGQDLCFSISWRRHTAISSQLTSDGSRRKLMSY